MSIKLKIPVRLVVVLMGCFISTANAQKVDSILDQIARSLPQTNPEWKHKGTQVYRHDDGSAQASIKWSNGKIELGATVILHKTLKGAKRAFRSSGKEDLQEAFRIDAIGDEAFLWPPKAPADGAYNIRFRKRHVEVWIGAGSEDDLKRYSRAIAAAIAAAQ
jgi:hypothetical protein